MKPKYNLHLLLSSTDKDILDFIKGSRKINEPKIKNINIAVFRRGLLEIMKEIKGKESE